MRRTYTLAEDCVLMLGQITWIELGKQCAVHLTDGTIKHVTPEQAAEILGLFHEGA